MVVFDSYSKAGYEGGISQLQCSVWFCGINDKDGVPSPGPGTMCTTSYTHKNVGTVSLYSYRLTVEIGFTCELKHFILLHMVCIYGGDLVCYPNVSFC